jgi:hypothetical protein
MDYSNGNPVVVYTCNNCGYTTFGEAYITDNKTTITFSDSITSSTTTVFEPTGAGKKDSSMTTFTRR